MKLLDKFSLYHLVIAFLISLYILGCFKFGFEKVLWQVAPALFSAIVTDSLLKYFKLKRWGISISAIISGLIIGLVSQFGENLWILAALGFFAMTAKFFIKLDGRHIFN